MGQLLQYNLKVREQEENESDMMYMVTGFIPSVRDCLERGGFTSIENNREEGGTFIVGYKDKAYTVYNDFQINHFFGNISSVGSGANFALGAMSAFIKLSGADELNPEKILTDSLEIAGKFSNGVSAPYFIRRN